MTPTATRTETNKANAQHSTGPHSTENTRFNARRHNLTGHTLIMTSHELAAYTKSSRALNYDLDPQGESEERLVQSIADAQWQLDRARAIEQNLFFELTTQNLPADEPAPGEAGLDWAQAQAKAFLENSKQFDLLARYATRFQRQILQLHATLAKAQKDRRALENERAENQLRIGSDSLHEYVNGNRHNKKHRTGFVSQNHQNTDRGGPVTPEELRRFLPNQVKNSAA